ncbi:MAG: hypothetical protein WBX25_31275 [Rhodomicrobium sp.]
MIKTTTQGRKTHEEQIRILERKPDVPEKSEMDAANSSPPEERNFRPPRAGVRESEFPVSRGGLHQESRGQNKHNKGGKGHHKPQKHSPAEEKL